MVSPPTPPFPPIVISYKVSAHQRLSRQITKPMEASLLELMITFPFHAESHSYFSFAVSICTIHPSSLLLIFCPIESGELVGFSAFR